MDSTNYKLWQTQVQNVLRANGYLGYVYGSVRCPDSETEDHNRTVLKPDKALWIFIDGQLLTCLMASISPQILPQVLGLDQANRAWNNLEKRFSSLSRSHIHDLKTSL